MYFTLRTLHCCCSSGLLNPDPAPLLALFLHSCFLHATHWPIRSCCRGLFALRRIRDWHCPIARHMSGTASLESRRVPTCVIPTGSYNAPIKCFVSPSQSYPPPLFSRSHQSLTRSAHRICIVHNHRSSCIADATLMWRPWVEKYDVELIQQAIVTSIASNCLTRIIQSVVLVTCCFQLAIGQSLLA